MRLFKKLLNKALDRNIGCTVIRFITHGCMGHIDEFDYIGVITDVETRDGRLYYRVRVLKSANIEERDYDLVGRFALVPSWYLQKISRDIFVSYD